MGHVEDLENVMVRYFGNPGKFLVQKALNALNIADLEKASEEKKEDLADFIVDNFLITIMSEQKASFTRGEIKVAMGAHLAGAVTYMTHD